MEDKYTKLGDLYKELGSTIIEELGEGQHRVVVYAEAGEQWTGVSIYIDEKERILYRDDIDLVGDIVMDIWYAQAPSERWVEMQLDIDGSKFKARQFYADNLSKRENYDIRRERAARERFGDKPIYYPPLGIDGQ